MNPDWGEITKALYEHSGFGNHCWYPDRSSFRNCATKTGRITEAEYERRQAMNGDLFTKNETDIALLRRCITEKWIPIYEGKGSDMGTGNCPLCTKYSTKCRKCPISEDTKYTQCNGTPYEDSWMDVAGIHQTADTPEKKLAALEEIVYLEGLIAKLTKAEEAEKAAYEEAKAAAAIQAKIEKEKKVYHPLVFYITLEEPTDVAMRFKARAELAIFLEKQGIKVKKEKGVRYSFTGSNHLVLDTKTGKWSWIGIPIISE